MIRLYHFPLSPFCRKVRLVLAEKKLEAELVEERYWEGRADFLQMNPLGKVPVLRADGLVLPESGAICEYLEEKSPNPPLIGTNAEERGEARMWTRRIDLNICEPMANGFRFGEGVKMFQSRMRVLPEASAGLKAIAQDNLGKLNGWIEGKEWVCGDRFTMADILLFCWLDFFKNINQSIDPEHKNIQAWYDRVAARPSAALSAG